MVPRTTLRFSSLLKELKDLRIAIILMDTVYYSGRIQIKISNGKGARSRVQENEGQSFQLSSFSGVMWTALISLKNNV